MSSPDVSSFNSAPDHAIPKAQELRKTEIDGLLLMNYIELAQSKWASLIEFAPKNRSLRSCRDFRKLNAVTLKDAYSIAEIN